MTVDELRNFALEKSKKPNDSWETGDGDELRYNLLISFERLVKCFLSENESYQVVIISSHKNNPPNSKQSCRLVRTR